MIQGDAHVVPVDVGGIDMVAVRRVLCVLSFVQVEFVAGRIIFAWWGFVDSFLRRQLSEGYKDSCFRLLARVLN